MTHWGWYWKVKKKHVRKPLCSNLISIDSFSIFKNGDDSDFAFLEFVINKIKWIQGVEVKEEELIILLQEGVYNIPIERQACHFGGFRYFFHCPQCQARMRMLYSTRGMFLCRKCWKLGYFSQILRPVHRYAMMQAKIEERLESEDGDLFEKPKWMRKKAYKRLEKRYWDYECKHYNAYCQESLQRFGRIVF